MKRTPGTAMRISQATARCTPPPMQWPFKAPISGTGSRAHFSITRAKWLRMNCSGSKSANSRRSNPEVKARSPAPVRITARSVASAAISPASRSRPSSAPVPMALRRDGLSKVTRRMSSSRSTRTDGIVEFGLSSGIGGE